MSGRAIIVVVTGIIIISSVIFYNIEAASTRITANFNDYYLRQSAQNIAQSGINLSLRQLANNRTWRTGFSNLNSLGGKVTVKLVDTVFAGVTNAISIQSVGFSEYGSKLETQAVSTVYAYFPPGLQPIAVKGLITLNGSNQANGNIDIDARDHDLAGNVVAGQGTYAVWTSGLSFTLGGSSQAGGTVAGVDFGLSAPAGPGVIQLGQIYPGGYPGTPDSAFGGASSGYPEGTLKSIAQTGVAGSQYVTDPSKLKYPLSGVTYIELPTSGSNVWTPPQPVNGTGILIVHNSAKNACIKNLDGSFAGIMVADDIVHLHGNFLGAIIGLTNSPTGNVVGNGNARIKFSKKAIANATSFEVNGSVPKVIAWWE